VHERFRRQVFRFRRLVILAVNDFGGVPAKRGWGWAGGKGGGSNKRWGGCAGGGADSIF
jgi:hypothetical protein